MDARTLMAVGALLLAVPAPAEVPIDPGETATIRLGPQGELRYPVAPPRPRAPANFGAILAIDIDEGGRYHVALGADGWIGLVRGGEALVPVGRRPGEAGSGIATIVDFDLVPGRYTLALSGMTGGEVAVRVSR